MSGMGGWNLLLQVVYLGNGANKGMTSNGQVQRRYDASLVEPHMNW
jgi:hypothetical protein